MIPGRWYDQSTAGVYDPTSNLPIPAGIVYTIVPFNNWSLRNTLYRRLGFDVDTAPSSDINMHFGIYTDNNGEPTTKIAEVSHTQAAATPTGPVEILLDVTIPPGLHWLCVIFDNSTATGMRVGGWDPGSATEGFSLLGDDSPAGSTSIPKRWGWASGPLLVFPPSLPDDFAAISLTPTDRIPRICLQG
jgi:hypothetical protein